MRQVPGIRYFQKVVRDVYRNRILASPLIPGRLRPRLWLLGNGSSYGQCSIAPFGFVGSGRMTVGDGVAVNYGYFLDPTAGIVIGDFSRIGPRCSFITASHLIGDSRISRTDRASGTEIHQSIIIGDHVWIGANVTVLPGVRIGGGSVVAAGAVVARDVDENSLVGGVPARLIRRLNA